MHDTLVAIYQQLLENEISNHNIFINVLLGIVIILLGTTWVWNVYGINKRIEQKVEKRYKKEKIAIRKAISKELEKELSSKLEEYENRFDLLATDIARSIALTARYSNNPEYELQWWAKVLEISTNMNAEKGIRTATDSIISSIDNLQQKDEELEKIALANGETFTPLKISNLKKIRSAVNKIPGILHKEKKDIIQKLKDKMDDE